MPYWTTQEIIASGGVLSDENKKQFKKDFDQARIAGELYLRSIGSNSRDDWLRVFLPIMKAKGYVFLNGEPSNDRFDAMGKQNDLL
jgi:hypothetical protein